MDGSPAASTLPPFLESVYSRRSLRKSTDPSLNSAQFWPTLWSCWCWTVLRFTQATAFFCWSADTSQLSKKSPDLWKHINCNKETVHSLTLPPPILRWFWMLQWKLGPTRFQCIIPTFSVIQARRVGICFNFSVINIGMGEKQVNPFLVVTSFCGLICKASITFRGKRVRELGIFCLK